MKIFDENDVEILEPDYSLGYIIEDRMFVQHHDALPYIQEEGHYEVLAEYPETGGKDVKWVIDIPGQEAKDAWDEYEDILRYKLFTQTELNKQEMILLKGKLTETDYIWNVINEGDADREHYADVIQQRHDWRMRIRQLEQENELNG